MSVRTVVIKPHLPSGGLGGGDPDYPNNSIGTSRLNALNFIRTACDNFNTANTNISILDGGSYALDTPTDYVHPSVAGYDAMGQAVAALVNYEARITPRA
jgi:lysophospholipase L1-like esterase